MSIISKLQLKVIVQAQLRFICEWCHAERNHMFSSVSSISLLILSIIAPATELLCDVRGTGL
jgi:hypothetical protein